MRKRKDPNVGDREPAAVATPQPGASQPETPQDEDQVLIRCFLESGDPKAFEELVERHRPMIRRLLYTLFGGQREEMEDAEQEIILSLFQGLEDFRFRSSFRTYLYRLARNRGIDCLRRKRSRERTLIRVRAQFQSREPTGPEQQALHRERIETLLGVFEKLRAKDRELILMKDIDDFSIGEIAAVLGVPSGTVKSRLHRAREKLLRFSRGVR